MCDLKSLTPSMYQDWEEDEERRQEPLYLTGHSNGCLSASLASMDFSWRLSYGAHTWVPQRACKSSPPHRPREPPPLHFTHWPTPQPPETSAPASRQSSWPGHWQDISIQLFLTVSIIQFAEYKVNTLKKKITFLNTRNEQLKTNILKTISFRIPSPNLK